MMFGSGKPGPISDYSRWVLRIDVLSPIIPTAFSVWIWTLFGLIPGKEIQGLIAKSVFVSFFPAPWIWVSVRAIKELRRRRHEPTE